MKIVNTLSSLKPLIIFIMLLLLLIPVSFIKSLISNREYHKEKAELSIMEPVGYAPVFEGIVLAVPYDKPIEYWDGKNNVFKIKKERYYIFTVPENYSFTTGIHPQYLSRGIFNVPVFNGKASVLAEFSPLQFEVFNIDKKDILFKDAVLILGVGSKKTFTAQPALQITNRPINTPEKIKQEAAVKNRTLSPAFINPDGASHFTNAVYYTLEPEEVKAGFLLSASIEFQGGKSFQLIPLAENNTFNITSSWKSPSFKGGWLPVKRELTENGFSANWNISGLSTSFPRMWTSENTIYDKSGKKNKIRIIEDETIAVDFITPINNYSLAKRCITYALLFLAVPFLAIFLCELWSAVKIHPVQYFLIGIADVIFYLLILSISEHLSFKPSYLIACAGVCASVLFYAAAIFKSINWGLLLSAVQAISYLLLFTILQSEDYALLIGSIGIFCVVVLLMFLTRKVDWYGKTNI